MESFQAATWWPLLAGVIGLFLGSYLNVTALRWFRTDRTSPQQLSSRSQCPKCGVVLRWYELIPVLSFRIQRRRCRSCATPLSLRYPVVELLTAATYAVVAWQYGWGLQAAAVLVVTSVLLVIALIDLETQLIPDHLTGPLAVAVAVFLLATGWQNLVTATGAWLSHWLVGSVVGVVSIGAIVGLTRGRGMGIGDIKLAGVMGMTLGGSLLLVALFVAFVSGAFAGLILVGTGRLTMKSRLAFGPFLVAGWFAAVIWGTAVIAWYTGF